MNQKPMMHLIPATLLAIALCFTSCETDPPRFLWEGKIGAASELYVCCQLPGSDCYKKGAWGYPATLRPYVENDNLSGFFKNEDWQSSFPELTGQQDLINLIIANNPKGLFLKNQQGAEIAFVILKDKTREPVTDNVHVAFKVSPECDKVFNNIH